MIGDIHAPTSSKFIVWLRAVLIFDAERCVHDPQSISLTATNLHLNLWRPLQLHGGVSLVPDSTSDHFLRTMCDTRGPADDL